jgi:hypothetical protein
MAMALTHLLLRGMHMPVANCDCLWNPSCTDATQRDHTRTPSTETKAQPEMKLFLICLLSSTHKNSP